MLGLPPEDGEDWEDGDDDGLGICGMDDDCVDVLDAQPATPAAHTADHSRRCIVFGMSMNSPRRGDDRRPLTVGSALPRLGSIPAAARGRRGRGRHEIAAGQERAQLLG